MTNSRAGSETGGDEKRFNSVEVIFSRIILPVSGRR